MFLFIPTNTIYMQSHDDGGKKMRYNYKWTLYMILLLFSLFAPLTACQKQEEKSSKAEEKEKPPAALNELEELSEDLVKTLSEKNWSEAVKQTKSLHTKWNEFYPHSQKKGLPPEKAAAFNKDLNILTNLVIAKSMEKAKDDIETKYKLEVQKQKVLKEGQSSNTEKGKSSDTLKDVKLPEEVLPDTFPILTATPDDLKIVHAGIEVTKHIPFFMQQFEKKDLTPILQLKYYVRDIKISSKQKNWSRVLENVKKLNQIWPVIQPKVIEKKEPLAIQFNQSLTELKEVTAQKDPTLTTIKCDIALENIKKITEQFE
jgi:hypothetical protein